MCAWIWFSEIKDSQLKINHLNDTPSTKAAGGGIYCGVLLKGAKEPVKVRRTLSSVGTSSSNSQDDVNASGLKVNLLFYLVNGYITQTDAKGRIMALFKHASNLVRSLHIGICGTCE